MNNHKNQIPTTQDFTSLRNIDRLYGYLQVISKWNGKKGEPRYINKKDFSSQEAANELCVSSRTINRQINKLKEYGFILEENDKMKLPIKHLFTTIHPETLKYLYQIQTDNVITIYSFLRAMQWYYQDKNKIFFFTKRYLITEILGKKSSGSAYDAMDSILDLLDKLGLVKLACQKKKGKFGEYKVYAVIEVKDEIIRSNFPTIEEVFGDIYIPDEEEINVGIKEYWQNKKD
ncbi:segregation and condensation complex subunit ScpB [Enterococcus phage VRE9_4]